MPLRPHKLGRISSKRRMNNETNATVGQLVRALKTLVEILRLDPSCQWTTKFENDLAKASGLLNKCDEDDLHSLSASVRYVFRGMGSFNDYSPAIYNPATGKYDPIPGADDFEKVTQEVFDLSLKLISKE